MAVVSERERAVSRLPQLLSQPEFQPDRRATPDQRCHDAYRMLRRLIGELGDTTTIGLDLPTLFEVFDWSMVLSPDLWPVVSSHFTLATRSLGTLSTSANAASHLKELTTGNTVGTFLMTEFDSGSNAAFLDTEARWEHGGFTLQTPHAGARKFMPNVAVPLPRIGLVCARLIDATGRFCGVFPFVTRIRDNSGQPAAGVSITPLEHNPMFFMDNAVTSFNNHRVPPDAPLLGEVGELDDSGVFHLAPGKRIRDGYLSIIGQLTPGRVGLASAVNAAAKASLYIALSYARKRKVRLSTHLTHTMFDIPHVRDALMRGLAGTVARDRYGKHIKRIVAEARDLTNHQVILQGMLCKPFLQIHGLDVITTCRFKMGAQGMLGTNRIADYVGAAHAAITGEGDCSVLATAAGRTIAPRWSTMAVDFCEKDPADPAAHLFLIAAHARWLARKIVATRRTMSLAAARLAVIHDATALADADATHTTLTLLTNVDHPTAHLFALDYLDKHLGWFVSHNLISSQHARQMPSLIADVTHRLHDVLDDVLAEFDLNNTILNTPALANNDH